MLKYCDNKIDRASNLRRNPAWIKQQIDMNSRWILMQHEKNLYNECDNTPVFFTLDQLMAFDLKVDVYKEAVFIGQQQGHSYFAIEVSELNEFDTNRALEADSLIIRKWGDLKQFGIFMDACFASILIIAKALCYWHRTHQFCGRCGSKNAVADAGHSRLCINNSCEHQTFPRTDPAVIMIVKKTFADGIERCLLGRQSSWPEGVYSTLAGFVDPGETLEVAVAREVEEEAGIHVENVTYLASQPWPFPSSIMLGFIADAKNEDICVDEQELEHAQWFSRDDLAKFTELGTDMPGYKFTGSGSISRYLIEYWYNLKIPQQEIS